MCSTDKGGVGIILYTLGILIHSLGSYRETLSRCRAGNLGENATKMERSAQNKISTHWFPIPPCKLAHDNCQICTTITKYKDQGVAQNPVTWIGLIFTISIYQNQEEQENDNSTDLVEENTHDNDRDDKHTGENDDQDDLSDLDIAKNHAFVMENTNILAPEESPLEEYMRDCDQPSSSTVLPLSYDLYSSKSGGPLSEAMPVNSLHAQMKTQDACIPFDVSQDRVPEKIISDPENVVSAAQTYPIKRNSPIASLKVVESEQDTMMDQTGDSADTMVENDIFDYYRSKKVVCTIITMVTMVIILAITKSGAYILLFVILALLGYYGLCTLLGPALNNHCAEIVSATKVWLFNCHLRKVSEKLGPKIIVCIFKSGTTIWAVGAQILGKIRSLRKYRQITAMWAGVKAVSFPRKHQRIIGLCTVVFMLPLVPFVLGLAFPTLTSPLLVHVFARDNKRTSVVRALRESRRI
ncbi:hypothetical protein C8R43DRAFT_955183 [Mycena crocata]|nr:hypothetical protein C8R43DRAFT_955183 [Mycena crocata]